MKSSPLALLALIPALLFSDSTVDHYSECPPLKTPHAMQQEKYTPLFIGPLVTPSSHVVKEGHYNIEPYTIFSVNTGTYDARGKAASSKNRLQINPIVFVQIGLADWIDLSFSPQYYVNIRSGDTYSGFGDIPIGFDIQLYNSTVNEWYPSFKLLLTETFPSGKYNNLNPAFDGLDAIGGGTFSTQVGLSAGKLVPLDNGHYLSWRSAVLYTFAPPAKVSGFHSYGGGDGTQGKVKVGDTVSALLGLEYSITRNWVFATDFQFVFQKKNSFSGVRGSSGAGEIASNVFPSGHQWSVAPAVEYNFNENYGLIVGNWTSFAGKNFTSFYAFIAAFNMYY